MRPAGEREPVIAIDGPAGAGKSTVARALAARLGYRVVDTGAMYRAVAWSVARAGLPPEETAGLRQHLARIQIVADGDRLRVDGHDVTSGLRSPEISELTSRLTALPAVREKITPLQRALAVAGGVILEGRDIGTVVCPDAEVKFYLDAALDTRARRRYADLKARGESISFERVRADITARDVYDQGRALAPLRKAADAIEVDTTELTVDQVVDLMLTTIAERRCYTRS